MLSLTGAHTSPKSGTTAQQQRQQRDCTGPRVGFSLDIPKPADMDIQQPQPSERSLFWKKVRRSWRPCHPVVSFTRCVVRIFYIVVYFKPPFYNEVQWDGLFYVEKYRSPVNELEHSCTFPCLRSSAQWGQCWLSQGWQKWACGNLGCDTECEREDV